MTMECNKEEAIRAKGIAESKMQGRDFVGARKIVLKAQQLFPDLENVSQMLTVCEVHCSAESKVNGETDWYAILQVEPTADESTIKKQYRKLALLLHPDKNKFAGAEAAFKLVGEAHITLSDQAKRALHDMKRGANFKTISLRQPAQQSNRSSGSRRQTGVSNNAANKSSAQFNGPNQTFWTICPFCGIRYQYYQSILNKALRCQSCMKPFIAYDLNAQAVPSGANSGYPWNHTGIPQEFRGPGAHSASQKSHFGNASSGIGFQGNLGGGSTSSQPGSKSGFNTEFGDKTKNKAMEDCKMDNEVKTGNEVKFEKVKLQEVNKTEQVVKPSVRNAKQKRGRKLVVESSDSESSDSDVVIEEDNHPAGQKTGTTGSNPRRSTRQKPNISYNEDGIDDDFVSPSVKRSRKSETSYNASRSDNGSSEGYSNGVDVQATGVDKKDTKWRGVSSEGSLSSGLHEREQRTGDTGEIMNNAASSRANPCVDSSKKTSTDMESLSYPDPEFFDFEKEREASKFAVDQIWAVYDDNGGMPRFYVRIRSVYSPEFKLRFTWLEHDAIGKAEMEWSEEELPVACGNFRLGKSETTTEKLMFSHLMAWGKGKRRNSYDIYPRKGEVWALFKDWDIGWSADADNHRVDYEFEVVEVLSDYSEDVGSSVCHLVKIKGFVSLFMRVMDKGMVPFQIPPGELLRFSHMVPSYRMTGEERDGIPAGSFELDTASLPSNFAESFPSIILGSSTGRVENLDNVSDGRHCKSSDEVRHTAGSSEVRSFQLNGKHAHEQSSINPHPDGLNGPCKNEHVQADSGQHSFSAATNHIETETMTHKLHSHTEKNTINAQGPSTSNATERDSASPVSSPIPSYEYPDPEFHNFEQSRSSDKFECGQIWALYSDIDRYPNYYGRIGKVNLEDFEVHVTWLQAYAVRKEEKRWLKEMPVSCGTFKIINEISIFNTTETFSHLAQAVPGGRKDQYVINPNAGEVWALYKNWSIEWSRSNLEDCEYDVVEILSCRDSGVEVLVLTKVDGYRAVFMPERKGLAASTMEIPMNEYMRFSHQIPAFRLTEERGGKLRGYWELDPASVPDILLFMDD